MTRTPASLLERLRQPSAAAAWTEFVSLYTPLLYYWARRTVAQPQDAADLVQEVFTTLVPKLPEFQYDRQQSFRQWLRTVLLNKWREKQRRQALPLTANGEAALANCAQADPALETSAAEYRRLLVQQALRIMERDFEPLTWKACWENVVAGRPAAEVAAELDVNVDVIYSAKSRVLRRLRQELQGLLD
jgi:RNA polymerase sigma-70 factor (ECF subfamily)